MKFRFLTIPLAALLCASACAKVKNTLSLSGSTPDEFSVVGSQPLSTPPEFRLPPPGEETDVSRMRAASSRLSASTLRGEGNAPDASQGDAGRVTEGEGRFLDKIGASDADARARGALDAEAEAEKPRSVLPTLGGNGETESVIDAGAERARIEKIRQEGGDVTGEGAASEKKGDHGVLGKWLGW
ncbi:MAG: DUF3035 domain-containing protein [Rickettsiales bacterium]